MSRQLTYSEKSGLYCGTAPFVPGKSLSFSIPEGDMSEEYQRLKQSGIPHDTIVKILLDCDYWACKELGLNYFDTSEDDWYDKEDTLLTYNEATNCYEDPGLRYIIPKEALEIEASRLKSGLCIGYYTRGKRKGKPRVIKDTNPGATLVRVKYWRKRYEECVECECWWDFIWIRYGIDLRERRPGSRTNKPRRAIQASGGYRNETTAEYDQRYEDMKNMYPHSRS